MPWHGPPAPLLFAQLLLLDTDRHKGWAVPGVSLGQLSLLSPPSCLCSLHDCVTALLSKSWDLSVSPVSPRGPKHSPVQAVRTKVNSSPQSLILYSVWGITQIKRMFQLCFILYHNSDFSHFNVRPAYKCLLSFPVLLVEKHNIIPRFLVTAGFVLSGLRKNSEACFTFLRSKSSFYMKK